MPPTKNILLVDDDSDDQEFFVEALIAIKPDYTLQVAKNGKETLDKLKDISNLPDLIFMDINMPVMNGIECLKEIKKIPLVSTIPVIMISTSTTQFDLARQLGAKAFIQKPPTMAQLRSELMHVISLIFITSTRIEDHAFYPYSPW